MQSEDRGGVVSPVFVGRQAELGAVRAVVEQTAGGGSGMVLIAGEAGVGKTRLVEEATGYARQRGLQVLSGHCVQLGQEGLPFAPIAEALRELVREAAGEQLDEVLGPARELVSRLIPTTGGGTGETIALSGSQVLELVLGLIERLSSRRPLLLVIEDLHWADRSTLELAAFLAQNLRGVPAALLITYRSDEVDRRHPLRLLLTAWERTRSITRLELSRFGRDEVEAQLAGILGAAPDPELLELVYDRSEGNAFLAEEMLSVVRSGDPRGLPPSLKDVLLARVDQLTRPAEQLLRLAAVAGRSVPERLLVAVSGLAETEVFDAVRQAVDAHLLVVDDAGYGYTFRHALARDAVYDDLLPGERVRLHAAYAEALSGDPQLLETTDLSVAASLAHHSYAALDLPRALEASIVAGREAVAGLAPREGLAHYERALQIWPRVATERRPEDLDQADVLWLAGDAAYQGGDVDRAVSLLSEAMAELPPDASPERRARLMQSCARAHRDLGRASVATRLLEQALDLLPDEPLTTVRAEVLAALSTGVMRELDMARAHEYAERAAEAARLVGSAEIEADALITLGYSRAHLGRPDDGVAAMQAGLELGRTSGNVYVALRGSVNLSDLLETLGRSQESVAAAEDGLVLAQQSGLLRTLGTYLTGNLAESLLHLGEWDRARALVDDALDGQPEGIFEATAQIIRAELALLAGDHDLSRSSLARTKMLLIDPDDDQFAHPLATIQADLARAGGDLDGAREIVLAALPGDDEQLSQRYVWPLVWTGVRAEVDRLAARFGPPLVDPTLVELAGSLGAATAPARAYRAMCAAELGRVTASSDWASAGSAWRALSWPWPLAYALLRQAEGHLIAERRDAAREPLIESWQLATRLGARPLVAEAERLAGSARVKLGRAADAAEPDGLAAFGLTAREREVLLLVAAGRSNSQIAQTLFISPKTASVHVSNILAKLGLSSRVQAAAVVHRLGVEI